MVFGYSANGHSGIFFSLLEIQRRQAEWKSATDKCQSKTNNDTKNAFANFGMLYRLARCPVWFQDTFDERFLYVSYCHWFRRAYRVTFRLRYYVCYCARTFLNGIKLGHALKFVFHLWNTFFKSVYVEFLWFWPFRLSYQY